jgi:hypothetical protein
MPRERWFYAKDMRRMGPLPRRQLVQSLLALPNPRGCLVWRHGLAAWTPARDVPEIDLQLAPLLKAEAEAAVAEAQASPAAAPAVPVPAAETGARAPRARQPNVLLYFGGLAALLVVVVLGWIGWRAMPAGTRPPGAEASGTGPAAPGAAGASPDAVAAATAAGGPAAFAGWSDQEADLPPDQLRRLRGVGGWSGNTLTITLYNGSTWRITEILVRTSELRGEDFVDADTPNRLVPEGVDAGVADLLHKVAPDRRKAGVNPLDAGKFHADVGPKPDAYRWRIEGARGYPPRS